MAPIYMDLQALEAANPPVLAFLSVVIFFVLAITLLALCTSCQRQSFTLDAPVERNSSSLVRVVKPGNGVDNSAPRRTDLTILPEDLELGPNQQFKPWRSHTIDKIPQPTINGVSGTVAL